MKTPKTDEALLAIFDRSGHVDKTNAPEELVTLCRELERENELLRLFEQENKRLRTLIDAFLDVDCKGNAKAHC